MKAKEILEKEKITVKAVFYPGEKEGHSPYLTRYLPKSALIDALLYQFDFFVKDTFQPRYK